MVFSSIMFIFRFLPIALILYYLAPKKLKNFVLLAVSMFFYAWGEVRYVPIMLITILANYGAGLLIRQNPEKRWVKNSAMALALAVSLGQLLFFKYTNFFISNINALLHTQIGLLENLTLPLGISFYTFQALSYTIDVYRGKVQAERNIIDFGAFVVLFPQLIAGPIVKYTDINRELKSRKITLADIEEGIRVFLFGLAKKVLIANNIGALWTQVEQMDYTAISTPLAWLGVLAFSLQIYFDFSGYSQMAIGLGRMLGFKFPQNFNFPYISRSITEFWRRWHITLSSWFREYIYIPLGGNRVSKPRMYLNLFLVWAATGFWHGASWNFVLWGLFFFVFLVLEKAFLLPHLERSKVLSRVYVLFLLLLGWALFAVTDMSQLGQLYTTMFTFKGGVDWIYYLRNYAVTIVAACICSTPLIERLYRKIQRVKWLDYAVLVLLFLLCVAYLVDATYNPFLYFRF